MQWQALESDPEIFTSYFRAAGLSAPWRFDEVFTLDMEVDCQALILAYRSTGNEGETFQGENAGVDVFIQQIRELDNACGLIAALHCIANSEAQVQPGSALDRYLQSVRGVSPSEAGQALNRNAEMHAAHSQFAQEGQSATTDSPDYHYVALIPGGVLVDGMKASAIRYQVEGETFCQQAFNFVRKALEEGRIGHDMSLMSLTNS